jgi:phytoene dehydrogenase-like protein
MAPALKTLKLTRRSAISGLVSAVSCPALAGSRSEPDFDVLIIGSGAAGIAAGRRLLASNNKFAILEAGDRMGGRCFTDTATFKLPYDRGACSIHLPAQSSLAKLAAQNGTELYPDPERQQFRVRSRNGLEKNLGEIHSKLELEEFYAKRVRCYAAIAQAAAGKDDIILREGFAGRPRRLAPDHGIRSGALSLRHGVVGAFRQGIRRFC